MEIRIGFSCVFECITNVLSMNVYKNLQVTFVRYHHHKDTATSVTSVSTNRNIRTATVFLKTPR